jgi:hypothetical protein
VDRAYAGSERVESSTSRGTLMVAHQECGKQISSCRCTPVSLVLSAVYTACQLTEQRDQNSVAMLGFLVLVQDFRLIFYYASKCFGIIFAHHQEAKCIM